MTVVLPKELVPVAQTRVEVADEDVDVDVVVVASSAKTSWNTVTRNAK